MKRHLNKVSIIIPFFSGVGWLAEAVESVLNQTYNNYELIVINDGSSENMDAFVAKYESHLKYVFQKNSGPGSARNKGIEMATGEYIAFLDSDDLWYSDKLEKQVELMNNSNATWSHTGYMEFKGSQDLNSFIRPNNKGNVFSLLLLTFRIATPTVMVRSDYLKVNRDVRFSEKMRYGQDHFFWLKLALYNKLEYLPAVLTKVRIRGKNADLRTRVKLQVAGQLWQYFKSDKKLYFKKGRVDFIIRCIYSLNNFFYQVILFVERDITNNKQVIEFLSKIFFLIPYVLRKGYAFVLAKKLKRQPNMFDSFNQLTNKNN